MRFSMSDDEIKVSYNNATDRKAQVKILAELNAVPIQSMAEKLKRLGFVVPEIPMKWTEPVPPLREVKPNFDVELAKKMFEEGKPDKEIAEAVGLKRAAFTSWRQRMGWQNHPPKQRQPRKSAPAVVSPEDAHCKEPIEAPAPLSAMDIGSLILSVSERYRGLTFTVNGAPVRGVNLHIQLGVGDKVTFPTMDMEVW